MFEPEDETLERAVRHLRRPPALDPAFDARVMRAIALAPAPPLPGSRRALAARLWPWAALAAVLAALVVARPGGRLDIRPGTTDQLQFVLVDPQAGSVALVGDFNDWDPARTPMHAAAASGVWSTVVPLGPGRYRYAFLVDGAQWRADPAAPASLGEEFGAPSSVVTVGGS